MRLSHPVTIYALRDPRTNQTKYCGATQLPLKARLGAHLAAACSGVGPLTEWLRDLGEHNMEPEIVELQVIPPGRGWRRAEQRAIHDARKRGEPLVNVGGGGEGMRPRGPAGVRRVRGRPELSRPAPTGPWPPMPTRTAERAARLWDAGESVATIARLLKRPYEPVRRGIRQRRRLRGVEGR